MLKLIPKSSYQVMPWKNGLGTTSQIAIFPEDATFPDGNFHWRLSTAEVSASSPFSLFGGCDRWLAVLQGQGLELNGSRLEPFTPLNFSGEIPIQCTLLGEHVKDLGLIYRREKLGAHMAMETLTSSRTLFFERGSHLFYALNDGLKINEVTAQAGDTIHLEGPFEVTLSCPQKMSYIYLKLFI